MNPARAKSRAEARAKRQLPEKRLPAEISKTNTVLRPSQCLARMNGMVRGF